MTYWRRFLVAAIGALSLVGAGTAPASAEDTLIEFDSITPVTGSAVGHLNDRNIMGGGLPWVITSGSGEVDRQGNVEIEVKGLIIPASAGFGFNPAPKFQAVVSCLGPSGVVNVKSAAFPASRAGDSEFETTVALPHPCNKPEVFVGTTLGSGVFVWFARSNVEDED